MSDIDLIRLYEENPEGDVQPTGAMQKVTIDGTPQNLPVYRIRTSLLRYNPQNDRIATWMSAHRETEGELPDPVADLEKYNDTVGKYIVRSNEDAIKKTEKNIALVGQQRPGTVLVDGLIVDGNRRFTCVRRLEKDGKGDGWFEAVILPREIGRDRKTIKMLELAIQHGEEERVGYDPVDRLVGIYNDILNPETRLLTPEEYAQTTNMLLKEVQKSMQQAEYMMGFLEFAHAPKAFHVAREYNVAGPLLELPAILKKCKDRVDEEDVRAIVYANIIAEPQGDITRYVRRMKAVLDSDAAASFVEEENELCAQVDEILEEAETAHDGIENVRADEELLQQFRDTMDDAEAQMRRQKSLESPLDSLRKASRALDQVQGAVFPHLERGDLEQIASVLDLVVTRVQRICDEFEPYRPSGF